MTNPESVPAILKLIPSVTKEGVVALTRKDAEEIYNQYCRMEEALNWLSHGISDTGETLLFHL